MVAKVNVRWTMCCTLGRGRDSLKQIASSIKKLSYFNEFQVFLLRLDFVYPPIITCIPLSTWYKKLNCTITHSREAFSIDPVGVRYIIFLQGNCHQWAGTSSILNVQRISNIFGFISSCSANHFRVDKVRCDNQHGTIFYPIWLLEKVAYLTWFWNLLILIIIIIFD